MREEEHWDFREKEVMDKMEEKIGMCGDGEKKFMVKTFVLDED